VGGHDPPRVVTLGYKYDDPSGLERFIDEVLNVKVIADLSPGR